MKKNLRKVFAMSMAGAMVAGCIPAMAEEASTTNWEPFAENVTLRVPVYDRGAEGVPNVSDNYWTKWIQEHFGDVYNVTVEYVPITRTDVMTSYALLAADKNLPTILMEYDYPKVAQWADDGYLTSFDMDDFKEIAPTYYASMEEGGRLLYSQLGGETYFALAERPYYNTVYSFQTFVRMDWLKEVGYDHVPEGRAEYLDAMQKIMDAGLCEHPGGGVMLTGVGSDQNQAYRTYPTNEEEWAMYGDYNIPALGWEPNYNLIKRANEDYNLGITDPEYYIIDTETAKANFVNGKSYSYAGYVSADTDFLNAFYEQNPDAELAISPIYAGVDEGEDGITTYPAWRAENPFGMIVGFSSTATEDELKAAWMYMEWLSQEDNLFTFQWGIEGENFNYDESGMPITVNDYSGDCKQGYNSSKDYWCIVKEQRTFGTIEEIIKANSPQGLPQDFSEDIIKYYYDRLAIADDYGLSDCQFSVVIAAQSEYQNTLGELYKEYRDSLTMCKPEEFDELYEKYAAEYLEQGYQEVIDERLEAFQDGNSTKLPEQQKAVEE